MRRQRDFLLLVTLLVVAAGPTFGQSVVAQSGSAGIGHADSPALIPDLSGISEYGRGLIDPDVTKPGLQVEITVEDPGVFTAPWSALITYRHAQGTWPEAVCAENTRGAGSAWVSRVPEATVPDF
jgi:hypothetical protein